MAKENTSQATENTTDVEKAIQEALEKYKADEDTRIAAAVTSALESQKADEDTRIAAAVANALESRQSTVNTGSAKTISRDNSFEELVEIEISQNNKDEGDVVVSVNGKTFQIKRGEQVKVPRYVVEVLENTKKMDKLRMKRIATAVKNFS